MALIKCPECGQQVSSEAKQCIHCGCKFTYCPECGAVSLGEKELCPVCGYAFSNKVGGKQAARSTASVTKETDLIQIWQNKNPLDKKILKGLKFVNPVVGILSFAMAIIAMVLLYNWKATDDPFEKLAKMADVKKNVQIVVAFSCIFAIFDFVFDYAKNAFVKLRCGHWLAIQDVDSVEYVNNYIKNLEAGNDYVIADEDDISFIAECAYISQNRSAGYSLAAGLAVRVIFTTVFAICLGVCAVQNAEAFFRAELYSDKFKLQYVSLIAAGIFLVIEIIAATVSNKMYSSKFRNWLTENVAGLTQYL